MRNISKIATLYRQALDLIQTESNAIFPYKTPVRVISHRFTGTGFVWHRNNAHPADAIPVWCEHGLSFYEIETVFPIKNENEIDQWIKDRINELNTEEAEIARLVKKEREK